jgi:hypothetical protein
VKNIEWIEQVNWRQNSGVAGVQELQNSKSPKFDCSNSKKTPTRFSPRRLLKKARCEPSQVFDLDLGAIDEIFGSVLDENDPTKSGNCEKCYPKHETKIPHSPILPVSGFDRKKLRIPPKSACENR